MSDLQWANRNCTDGILVTHWSINAGMLSHGRCWITCQSHGQSQPSSFRHRDSFTFQIPLLPPNNNKTTLAARTQSHKKLFTYWQKTFVWCYMCIYIYIYIYITTTTLFNIYSNTSSYSLINCFLTCCLVNICGRAMSDFCIIHVVTGSRSSISHSQLVSINKLWRWPGNNFCMKLLKKPAEHGNSIHTVKWTYLHCQPHSQWSINQNGNYVLKWRTADQHCPFTVDKSVFVFIFILLISANLTFF